MFQIAGQMPGNVTVQDVGEWSAVEFIFWINYFKKVNAIKQFELNRS